MEKAYGASPGYLAESSTMALIKGFLYAISALVVGAFFTVWTVQRKAEIALLKALGSAMTGKVPFTLSAPAVATAAGLLIGLGTLGAVVALRRITATALGANR